ncbi:DUF2124 domain-containing protein [Methanoregula sp.]|uniref:DUF2124 domain-containing protein n=1 Tax=Methanoregula sp. TaxID=2052170 RepID=UPI002CD6D94A|nr:DUF2124 domain-containing protein [Methanoregula sp.]HVP96827.1 DUF2124 domain-containing protein [Methanoregula sp.]
MTENEPLRGIPGILRPYKEYINSLRLSDKDLVVYYGCVGTCTPFAELLAVAIRGLHLRQAFVPLLDETKAHAMHDVPDIGMQASGEPVAVTNPKVLVIMGGLAMPMMPVTREQVRDLALSHPGAKVVGVCFQDMFARAGWVGTVPFDLAISAMIDPVTVTRAGQ